MFMLNIIIVVIRLRIITPTEFAQYIAFISFPAPQFHRLLLLVYCGMYVCSQRTLHQTHDQGVAIGIAPNVFDLN